MYQPTIIFVSETEFATAYNKFNNSHQKVVFVNGMEELYSTLKIYKSASQQPAIIVINAFDETRTTLKDTQPQESTVVVATKPAKKQRREKNPW